MTLKRSVVVVLILAAFAAVGFSAAAQSEEKFKVRLSPVPPLAPITQASVVGGGSASASLVGKKLSITGFFERLASPATVAHVFMGPVTAVRGTTVVFDLTVTKTGNGTTGMIAGSFDLSADQVDALKKGRLYIQIHSEGVPSGHLMGWLLK
jgi:hypothetical protein